MADELSLPATLLTHKNVLKMLTILFPCTLKKVQPTAYAAERLVIARRVFKENSSKTREKFFADPLIKYLWVRIFVTNTPETFISYLRQVRT